MNQEEAFHRFSKMIRSPVQAAVFLLMKLPSAYCSGVRVREISPEKCTVTVPYRWFTRNPFRSTYFACLAMAAEMSTGALAMGHLFKREPAVSMLVLGLEARYLKKAVGRTAFTCQEGNRIREAIETAIAGGAPQTVKALSVGRNADGEPVAEFEITWTFKARARP